ncbi:hypothetical protein PENSPDRAFT_682682 [Peniophora sp. CONT]|nr:hypothetical protein PENSPDRAFT_682682 [Peniophora sp. CONT]
MSYRLLDNTVPARTTVQVATKAWPRLTSGPPDVSILADFFNAAETYSVTAEISLDSTIVANLAYTIQDPAFHSYVRSNKFAVLALSLAEFKILVFNRLLPRNWQRSLSTTTYAMKMLLGESFENFSFRVRNNRALLEGSRYEISDPDFKGILRIGMTPALTTKISQEDSYDPGLTLDGWIDQVAAFDEDLGRERLRYQALKVEADLATKRSNTVTGSKSDARARNAHSSSVVATNSSQSSTTNMPPTIVKLTDPERTLLPTNGGCFKCRYFWVKDKHCADQCKVARADYNSGPLTQAAADAMALANGFTSPPSVSAVEDTTANVAAISLVEAAASAIGGNNLAGFSGVLDSASWFNEYVPPFHVSIFDVSCGAVRCAPSIASVLANGRVPALPPVSRFAHMFPTPPVDVSHATPLVASHAVMAVAVAALRRPESSVNDPDAIPLSIPQLLWDARLLNPDSGDGLEVECLVDNGSQLNLIGPEAVDALSLKKRWLGRDYTFSLAVEGAAVVSGAPAAPQCSGSHFVNLHLKSRSRLYRARVVRAIIAPGLKAKILLGLPWLVANDCIIDPVHRAVIARTARHELMSDRPLPGPESRPSVRDRELRAKAEAAFAVKLEAEERVASRRVRALHTSVMAELADRLLSVRQIIDPLCETVRRFDVHSPACVAAVIAEETARRHKGHLAELDKRMKAKFADRFESDIPIHRLSEQHLHRISLKDASKVVQERPFACPAKYRDAWKALLDDFIEKGYLEESPPNNP